MLFRSGGESEGGFFQSLGVSIGLGGGIADNPDTGTGGGTGVTGKDTLPPPPVNPSGVIGPLAILIATAESGKEGYNAYNRGTSDGKIIPSTRSRNLVSMSLSEVLADQSLPQSDPDCLRAVGKYQCVPKTLAAAIDSLKFDLNRKFDKLTQDIICQEYLVCRKRPALLTYYNNPDKNNENLLKKAGQDLAAEFASVEDPYYPGYPYKGPNYYYYKSGNRVGKTVTWLDHVRPTLIAEWEFRNSGK
mgnify:CR=1 FL=1